CSQNWTAPPFCNQGQRPHPASLSLISFISFNSLSACFFSLFPRFHINLKAGQDIALHINPRGQEQIVVRNSFLNGSWGPEERELPFNPFQPGQYFELSIRCGNHRFKVYVNGQPFFNYAHRYRNFPQIDTLQIDGDVVLSYIQC
uniref:Galectin n=1 Tax=Naja naja TaxID=35670 RepID=A0A8C6Y494_NAJNA